MARADITALDATAQLSALSSLRLSAVDLLRVSLAQRAGAAPFKLLAAENVAEAMERAKAVDEHRARGDTLGLLAGLPVTLTEGLEVEGLAAGRRDAAAVAKLRRAGAVIWGASRAEALNPWLPGIPARGAHAAVALGLSPLEMAVDRAGGLIREASHNGVFAHRPSRGLVRQRGANPPGFERKAEVDLIGLGPVARSARDLRLALSVQAEATIAHQAPPLVLHGLKVGLWLKEPDFPLDPEVASLVEQAASEISSAGASVQIIRCPVDAGQLRQTFAKLDKGARGARMMSHRAWLEADETRAALSARAASVFDGMEAIIAPAAGSPPSGRSRKRDLDPWPLLAVTLGLPVSVIPAGLTAAGAPVGVQVIGKAGSDSRVLSLAEAMDALLGGYRPPPLED